MFDPQTAKSCRRNHMSTPPATPRDPAEAYAAFRGRMPDVGPLLKKRGLVEGLEAPAPGEA